MAALAAFDPLVCLPLVLVVESLLEESGASCALPALERLDLPRELFLLEPPELFAEDDAWCELLEVEEELW